MTRAAPPRSFTFNATRANLAALFASQRDRLIQLTQPAAGAGQLLAAPLAAPSSLPPAYRMRGLEQQSPPPPPPTTITPQMLSTIDYVNVNRARPTPGALQTAAAGGPSRRLGLKLVCDIDQVFPVPEVSIFRLAGKLDGQAHPDKLAKLETRIERDPLTGLFHVQVTSVLDDDELQTIRQNQLMMLAMVAANASAGGPAGPLAEPEIYFECLIALTNLELSRYADNRRTLIYRPGECGLSLARARPQRRDLHTGPLSANKRTHRMTAPPLHPKKTRLVVVPPTGANSAQGSARMAERNMRTSELAPASGAAPRAAPADFSWRLVWLLGPLLAATVAFRASAAKDDLIR